MVYPDYSRAKKMFWLLILVLGYVSAEEICLSVDEDPYLYFGTKTAYIFANKDTPSSRAHEVPGCKPRAFWLISRHGSNNPEKDEVEELQKLVDLRANILSNYRNGNFRDSGHRICRSDLTLLEQWQWNPRHNLTFAGDLTSDGYMTTQQQAQAWKQRFSKLLTLDHYKYLFTYGNDHRAKNSFRAFTEGIFGAQADSLDIPKEIDEEKVKPQKLCPSWSRDVENNNQTTTQRRIFESKMEYKEMISNISLRLGFNYDLPKENIDRMYQMCRYNKAWDVVKISPWCSVFTHEDLKRLEYAEDLETYYKYGYGTPMNKDVGCTMVKDLMLYFDKHVAADDQPTKPAVKIYFADEALFLLTLRAVGAREDSAPLTGDNYHSAVAQSRRWMTSTMAPFNGNLAAVLYKCTQNGNFQVNEEYQVLFMENERPMSLEGCRVGLCDWSVVQKRLADVAKNCNLELCNAGNSLQSLTVLTTVICAFILIYTVDRI